MNGHARTAPDSTGASIGGNLGGSDGGTGKAGGEEGGEAGGTTAPALLLPPKVLIKTLIRVIRKTPRTERLLILFALAIPLLLRMLNL